MTQALDDKQKAQAAKARSAAMEAKEKELNKDRSGKGTRIAVSMTRGKGSVEVQYEAFDTNQAETLPTDLNEFMTLTGLDKLSNNDGEKKLIGWAIDGFNADAYSVASDPIAEFVEPNWPDEVSTRFKLAVRNYAAATQTSVEEAVAVIKPGIVTYLANQGKTQ